MEHLQAVSILPTPVDCSKQFVQEEGWELLVLVLWAHPYQEQEVQRVEL